MRPADPKSKFSLSLWTLTFELRKLWLVIIWKAESVFPGPFLKYQVFPIFQWEPLLKYETLKIKIQSYIAKILSFLISEYEKTGIFCILWPFSKTLQICGTRIMFRAFDFWIAMSYV